MTGVSYEIHEAAKLFPMIGKEELAELAADIHAQGLLNPIVLFEGKVLDGRSCEEHEDTIRAMVSGATDIRLSTRDEERLGKVWSVVEQRVTGWTLSEAKQTDLILFVFDRDDCETCYLVPFQHLRMAFRRYIGEWVLKYKRAKQNTRDARGRRWTSSCVFVPAPVVLDALTEVSQGKLPEVPA